MLKSLITVVLTIVAVSTGFAQSGKIIVDVSGIEKIEGQLALGLYNNAKDFPQQNKAYMGVFLEITSKNLQNVFADIPKGEYALAIFHDINCNKKLDKNFLGIPKEDYAFSNNAKGSFGPPDFAAAKFSLDSTITIEIKMND